MSCSMTASLASLRYCQASWSTSGPAASCEERRAISASRRPASSCAPGADRRHADKGERRAMGFQATPYGSQTRPLPRPRPLPRTALSPRPAPAATPPPHLCAVQLLLQPLQLRLAAFEFRFQRQDAVVGGFDEADGAARGLGCGSRRGPRLCAGAGKQSAAVGTILFSTGSPLAGGWPRPGGSPAVL